MILIDGKQLKDAILEDVRGSLAALSFAPAFTDVLIGNDAANEKYVAMKKKVALSLGFSYRDVHFPEGTTEDEIVQAIAALAKVPFMAGVIVQLPLPPGYDRERILNAVPRELDVDVLGSSASKQFYEGEGGLILPTARAVLRMLDSLPVSYDDKSFVIIGQGPLVGRPVAHLLRKRGYRVSTITRATDPGERESLLQGADVIVSAIGVPKSLTGDMIQEGVIVVDAGTSEMEGSLVGDVDTDSVAQKASYLTPSPGGVGPVTVASLFENVLDVAQRTYHA